MNTRLLPSVFYDFDAHARLIAAACASGWIPAILAQADGAVSGRELHRLFANDTAAAWSVLLPLRSRNRLLLVSPRSIAEVLAAARWFRTVVAWVDSPDDRAFLGISAEQSGLSNLRVICTDDESCTNTRFDAIAVRCEMRLRIDQSFLRRHLADQGVLFVSRDLPWRDGTFWPIRNSLEAARLNRHLRNLDLIHTRHFGVLPEFESPERIVPLQRTCGTRSALRMTRTTFKARVAAALREVPVLCPGAGIVASSSLPGPSWVEALVAHLCNRLSIPMLRSGFPDVIVSHAATGGLILFLGRDAVARVPFGTAGQDRVANNQRALHLLRNLRQRGLSCRTPEPLGLETFDGVTVGVESRILGHTVDKLRHDTLVSAQDRVFHLLCEFQRMDPPSGDADSIWERHAIAPFERSRAWSRSAWDKRMLDDLITYLQRIGSTRIPLRRSHGDYKLGNVLVGPAASPIGVIDWDLFRESSFATIDFCHLVMHRRAWLQRKPRLTALVDWLAGRGVDEQEAQWTFRFSESLSLHDGWRTAAALIYWAREFEGRLGTAFELRTDWIQQNFLGLLPKVHRLVLQTA